MHLFKAASVSLCALFMVACKIQINMPEEGGSVGTSSGDYACAAGQQCVIEVTDTSFNQLFFADPDQGWVFTGWKKARGYFCGGKDTNCALSTQNFAGVQQLLDFLETDAVFYLEPQFEPAEVGGAVWATQQLLCDEWYGSALSPIDQAPSDDEFGVLEGTFELPGLESCDRDEFRFEESPVTGEPRLRAQVPAFFQSQQGVQQFKDRDEFNYVELVRQNVSVERLSQVSNYPVTSGVETDNDIDSYIRYGYETAGNSEGRPVSYQEYERVEENGDPILIYEQTWEYESDGTVPTAQFRQYEEDLGYIEGTIRYVIENGVLVAYTEAEIFGDFYTLQKKIYPDKGAGDIAVPQPPPTGQIYTENAWVLPEASETHILDFETGELVPYEKQEILREFFNQGYPLETRWSTWDEEEQDWIWQTETLYGYKTDNEGTVYLWIELDKNQSGNSSAIKYEFLAEPLNYSP